MPVYLDCEVCGKEFSVPPSRAKTAKCCSNACAKSVRAASISKRVELICKECRKPFEAPPSHADRRIYCSNKCRNKSHVYRLKKAAAFRGSGNSGWKGGRTAHSDGYVYLSVGLEHPFSTPSGYVREHRVVMERHLRATNPDSRFLIQLGEKKYLSPDYVVHHIDENRKNNSIENLLCVTPAEHLAIHRKLRQAQ